MKTNIYKRCKPFNSRLVSLTASLLFLYLWHGIYPGFFNLFLVEILGKEPFTMIGLSCLVILPRSSPLNWCFKNQYFTKMSILTLFTGISSEEAVRRYFSKSLFPSALHHVLVAVQYLVKNSCVGYGLAGFALRLVQDSRTSVCHILPN